MQLTDTVATLGRGTFRAGANSRGKNFSERLVSNIVSKFSENVIAPRCVKGKGSRGIYAAGGPAILSPTLGNRYREPSRTRVSRPTRRATEATKFRIKFETKCKVYK